MHDSFFYQELKQAREVLDAFINDCSNYILLENAGKMAVEALRGGGKIIACGNGGSMSDAMHFAEELTGRFRADRPGIAAVAISDPAYLSCVANDYGYDEVFARFVSSVGKPGDMLLAISTSGNSTNVLKASEAASRLGMGVVSLTGKDGGRLRHSSDICINVAHHGYSDRVQEVHIKIIHSLILYIENHLRRG